MIANWNAITYDTPKIMGILNVTPDSFFDGGQYNTKENIRERIQTIITEGADIIDIGAYSSRPGAADISEQEEIDRLFVALRILQEDFPNILVSIDTFRLNVIKSVSEDFGTIMVNDISGGNFDKEMMSFSAKNKLPFVCMHMQGNPQTMQNNPLYENVTTDVLRFFESKIKIAQEINLSNFVIDPGFGFGKTLEQNYKLMNNLEEFVNLQYPVLVGISRKSMIQKVLNCTAQEALNGTSVLNSIAIMKGASILRVHDVKAAKEVVSIVLKTRQ